MSVDNQTISIYVSFIIFDIGSAGVALLLLSTGVGPAPRSGTTAARAGVFVFILTTFLVVYRKSVSSISKLVVAIFFSYVIFSITLAGVFLLFYLPLPHA